MKTQQVRAYKWFVEEIISLFVIVDVNFDQLTYTITEDTMLLSPVIILSQPSPVTLTLSINLIDVNTTGKINVIHCSYGLSYICMHIALFVLSCWYALP